MMPATPPPVDTGALLRLAGAAELAGQVGACQQPIILSGKRLLVDADTGAILSHLDATDTHATVRCRSRRAAACPACSALYRSDAYHLIAAGLRGGKDTPEAVATRPRLFVTLTAPSFGPVHLGPDRHGAPRCCHPRRCGRWHRPGDPRIGTPIDATRYDYIGQVLFNAHAGLLWARLCTEVRRALADAAGVSRSDAAAMVRVVFAKVAEFQTRGVVHFHAVVRLDGASGPHTTPPDWATTAVLSAAIRAAARRTGVSTPAARPVAARRLRFGRQLDIQHLNTGGGVSDVAVASYVAKYATKSAEATGVLLPPLFCRCCGGHGTRPSGSDGRSWRWCRACLGTGRRRGVDLDGLGEHARSLVEACWRLGGLPALRHLKLRRWAHQLGYRGHVTTKSRSYSTTFTALRAERRDWMTAQRAHRLGADPAGVIVVADWRYAGPDNQRGAA